MLKRQTIVILDSVGAQSQLVARAVRDQKVYSEVLRFDAAPERIAQKAPVGIVLVGGKCAQGVQELGVPMLTFDVALLGTAQCAEVLRKFLTENCQCTGDWTTQAFIDDQIAQIRAQVGSKKVLCALSGGVDSSVTAVLLHKAVGEQLNCIFVDHGLMRKDEPKQVKEVFGNNFGLNLKCIDAEQRFLGKLAGVRDPETKRKIIGEEFIRVFEEEARLLGKVGFLAQGTIYPDIIESGIGGAMVKSHHNVGGLPKNIDFEDLVEPLKELFKDEVRAVGEALGIPHDLVWRQPFPGPGLGVRCIGELTKEKLDILRDADHIFREEIQKAGLAEQIWQYFAVLTDMRSVGVRNDARTYEYTVALRAVNSIDAMTATSFRIPYETLETVVTRITTQIPQVNRIVHDITGKPPATIEWE